MQHIWWNADVIVIGDEGLKKSHDVIQFLLGDARVASLGYCRDGVDAFAKAYPFLVGQSVKAHRGLVYPSPLRGCKGLYLGNWQCAEDSEKLKHLGITRLVTIHNDPRNLKFPGAAHQRSRTHMLSRCSIYWIEADVRSACSERQANGDYRCGSSLHKSDVLL